MDDFKLIELVRPHKCLYDANNKYYKDGLVRDNVWKEISDEMKQPSSECKNRWKNIRDTFRKHEKKQKLPTAGSSTAQKLRKWHLEKHLEFLQVKNERPLVTNTQTSEIESNNLEDEQYLDQVEELEHYMQEDYNIASGNPEEGVIIEDGEGLLNVETGKKRKKRQKRNSGTKRNMSDQIQDLFHKHSYDRQDISMKALEEQQETHPIDLFFNSMAASVRKLSMERQIRAKMEVSQIIGKLELEECASQESSASSVRSYCITPTEPLVFQSMNPTMDIKEETFSTLDIKEEV